MTATDPGETPHEPSELDLSRLFQIANDAFAIVSPDGVFRRLNPTWTRVLGWELDDLIGRPFIDFVHPDDRQRTLDEFAAIIEQGKETFAFTNRYRDRDGNYRMLDWTSSRALDTGYVYATARDVTERRALDDRFRRIADSRPNPWVVVDRSGTITLVNAQTETLLGYTRGELIGESFELLVPDRFRNAEPSLRTGFFANPEARPMGEGDDLYVIHKDGREIPVEIGLATIEDDDGLLTVATIVDVRRWKAAEQALQSAKSEAERANRAKSEFLSRMSHELRTPLNAVLGFAQLLELDGLTDEQRDSVKQISRGGRHLLDLINEVLDISRIETGQMTISPEPVGVSGLLDETVRLVAPLAADRAVTLDASAAACEAFVLADRQRLRQVLLNLLSNAVKYNRDGGSITVTCAVVRDEHLRIAVVDSGYGIPADQLGRLFQPFERLGAAATGVEGTGMGLALSKGLIEAMGGAIGVDSVVDRGTTFWVELELVASPLETYENGRSAIAPTAAESPDQRRTVLCIEDNLANVRLVERILAHRPGIELITAVQGGLGTDLARKHRPDLILLDLHLPDAPGEEILRRLRRYPETRDIPIVIISADGTKTQIARLIDEGAAGYLTKPLDVSEFFQVVDGLLADR